MSCFTSYIVIVSITCLLKLTDAARTIDLFAQKRLENKIASNNDLNKKNNYVSPLKLRPYGAIQMRLLLLFLAHQHKACRQLKIKQEMTAVGD